jgi:hypothetical protein
MFSYLFSRLPGSKPVKIITAIALFIAIEAILFTAVFPAIAQWRLTSPLVAY